MNQPNRSLLFLFLILISSPVLRAQNFVSQSFSDLYDFDVRTIYRVIQSSDERLWMGTDQGVFCFNQREIKRYADRRYQSEFSNLKEDPEGRIWFQNFSGHVFYIEDDSLHLYKDLSSFTRDGIMTVDLVNFPIIYINSEYGIFEFDFYDDSKSKAYEFVSDKLIPRSLDSLTNSPITDLIATKEMLYFADLTRTKIFNVKRGQEEVSEMLDLDEEEERKIILLNLYRVDNKVVCTQLKTDDELIFYMFDGDKVVNKRVYHDMNGIITQSIHYFEELQEFWIGTQRGVIRFNEDFELINEERALSNLFVSSFWRDSEGNYLLSTLNEGLHFIPNLAIEIYKATNSPLIVDNITGIIAGPEGYFFILDDQNNIFEYDLDKKQLKFLYKNQQRTSAIFYNDDLNVIHLFPSTNQYNLTTKESEINIVQNVKSLSSLGDNIWLNSQSSLGVILTHSDTPTPNWLEPYVIEKITRYKDQGVIIEVLRRKRSLTNLVIEKGDFYVAYSDALFHYHDGISEEVKFEDDPIVAVSLVELEGQVWIASTEGSLFFIDEKEKIQRIKGFRDAIKNIDVYKKDIIIACSKSIHKYNPISKELSRFDHLNGLITSEIHKARVFGDRVFVATYDGLFHYQLNIAEAPNSHFPSIHLDEVLVNGKPVQDGEYQDLSYRENNIQFNFSTYALKSLSSFQLAYRFRNRQDEWQFTNNLEINFSALQPGYYELESKIICGEGIDSIEPVLASFHIAYPFYQQAWFYGAVSLFSVLIVGAFLSYRFRVRKENALLQERLAMSTLSSIKAQMNPHFIFNAINSVQYFILKGDKDASYTFLNKLSVILRNILVHSEQDFIDAEEELKMIISYLDLEKLRFNEEDFFYYIEGDENLKGVALPSMIIQPFVENAVKHGLLHKEGGKKISISFELQDYLVCTIVDNGIGRKASEAIKKAQGKKRKSFSTSSIQKRFKILQEYYQLDLGFTYVDLMENSQAVGTKVVLKIPIK